MDGIVIDFNEHRKYGFIKPLIGKPEQAQKVFFHVSVLTKSRTVPIGARVSFKLIECERGVQAIDVEVRQVSADILLQKNEPCA